MKNLKTYFRILLLCYVTLSLLSCKRTSHTSRSLPTPTPPANHDVLDDYLRAEIPVADGFDFAIGNKDGKGIYRDRVTGKSYNGWYVATKFTETYNLGLHTGEDWNGVGGDNTDLGQNVFVVASGRVALAGDYGEPWGKVVVVDHLFYENHEKKQIRSLYAHLHEIKVQAGQILERRQLIGLIGQDPEKTFTAHLHLELRWDETLGPTYWPSSNGKDEAWIREHYAEPTAFINGHRSLPVPQKETTLVLIDQTNYRMRVYQQQQLLGEFQVSFGHAAGPKRVQGDNKTPIGMYFVIKKHRGQFDGPEAAYFGGYWIKINYPNRFDAARGRAAGLISAGEETSIRGRWERREPTLESTELGGGIGLHGWINEWDNAGLRHLSGGCVVMHLYDISKLYDKIKEGAMVVIL